MAFPSYLNTVSSSDRYGYEGLPPELAAEEQALNRKQQMATYLLQQGLQPQQGQMVGRFYVPPSPLQGLAGLAQAGLGAYGMSQNDAARQALSGKSTALLQEAMQNYKRASGPVTTEGPRPTTQTMPEPQPGTGLAPQPPPQPVTTELPGPGAPVQTPRSPQEQQQAMIELMMNRHPQAQRIGEMLAKQQVMASENELNRDVRREGIAANALMRAEQIRGTMATTQSNIDAREQAGRDANDLKKELARQQADLQKTLHGMDIEGRKDVATIAAGAKTSVVDAKAAKADEEKTKGVETVNSLVASLRDQFAQLQQAGGITDTTKGPLGNIGAGLASSGAGQAAGTVFGTKNQSLRNTIAQQRPILLQAIKSATGMSAKQMDSNVELKLYLSMATDPQLDVQANMKALDMIEKLFGGGVASAAPSSTDMTPTVPAFHDPEKQKRYEEFKKNHTP